MLPGRKPELSRRGPMMQWLCERQPEQPHRSSAAGSTCLHLQETRVGAPRGDKRQTSRYSHTAHLQQGRHASTYKRHVLVRHGETNGKRLDTATPLICSRVDMPPPTRHVLVRHGETNGKRLDTVYVYTFSILC